MSVDLSTITNNSGLLWSYFARKTLDVAQPQMVVDQLGDKRPLPQKYGKTVTFTKFKKLAAITSAGTPGTAPNIIALTSATITAAVSQYKNAVGYSADLVAMGSTDDLEKIIDELVASNLAETVDVNCISALTAAIGTTQYGGGRTALSALGSADKLTLGVARLAKNTLVASNVKPHSKGYYAFVGHPNTLYDMKTDTGTGGWIDCFKYNELGAKQLFNAEQGECDQIKFMQTTLIASSSSGTSAGAFAYTNMIFGYQPFGSVKLDGYSMELKHHAPGSSGITDPTDEMGSVAFNVWCAWPYFGGNATVADPERAIKVITGRAS